MTSWNSLMARGRALRPWLELIRWDTLFATLLALGSYPILRSLNVVFPAVASAEIFAATMLWNAYYDRAHDAYMGRTFAITNATPLRLYTVCSWLAVVITLLLAAAFRTWWEFCILLGMAVGGFVYAWCRLVPGMSMLMVAAVFTAPLLLGIPDPTLSQKLDATSFFAFILVVELRGDLRDWRHDRIGPWKKTVPVMLGMTGGTVAHTILSLIPSILQTVRVSQDFNPFMPPPLSAYDYLMVAAICSTAVSSIPLFLPIDHKAKMHLSGLIQKVAMICFVAAHLLD